VLHVADKELAEAEAELDATEPGWRWPAIEASREIISPEENSAPLVMRASQLIPKEWPTKPAGWYKALEQGKPVHLPEKDWIEQLLETRPQERLDPKLVAELREEVRQLGPAPGRGAETSEVSEGAVHG
jgi:hypothetical protein